MLSTGSEDKGTLTKGFAIVKRFCYDKADVKVSKNHYILFFIKFITIMSLLVWILGILLIAFGFLGCFVNKIPGPMLSFIGLCVLTFGVPLHLDKLILLYIFIGVLLSMYLSKKILPKVGALVAEYGKGGSWGATIGSLIGIFIVLGVASEDVSNFALIMAIIGAFIVLPYIFASLFEMIARKSFTGGFQAGAGALVAFLCGTMLKLAVCCYSIYAAFHFS